MTRDSKLPEIEIKRHDFTTEKQERVANILVDEWEENGPREYTKLEEEYEGVSRQLISKVVNEYIGPPDHDVTVGDIREEYGDVETYNEERMKGNVDLDVEEDESMRESWKEGYSEGYSRGYQDAMQETS